MQETTPPILATSSSVRRGCRGSLSNPFFVLRLFLFTLLIVLILLNFIECRLPATRTENRNEIENGSLCAEPRVLGYIRVFI